MTHRLSVELRFNAPDEEGVLPVPPPPGPAGWRVHVVTDGATTCALACHTRGERYRWVLAPAGSTVVSDAPVPLDASELLVVGSGAGMAYAWLTPADPLLSW